MPNRNVESHFALNPTRLDISRSTFDRSSSHKTSFDVGQIIPFYVDECVPGDTFNIRTSKVVRLQTMITPMMDNLYLDTYYFFVPNRLVWDHWREFCGENTNSAWVPTAEYGVPQVTSPDGGWEIGTLADYFGIPTGVSNLSVNAMPFRAYALIMNEWFRDENLTDPLNIPTGDATTPGSNGSDYINDIPKGGKPFIAAKYHDYLTSCLPAPQKGSDVLLPGSGDNTVPVFATVDRHAVKSIEGGYVPLSGVASSNTYDGKFISTYFSNGSTLNAGTHADSSWPYAAVSSFAPDNLWAINNAGNTTINQLRLAFQLQKLYERDARGGTRYIEIIKSHFGVTSPDARLQRPEYLGGNRLPINVNQIVQQSQTTDQSPQGNPVGLSLTTDSHGDFSKSFVEHGFVIGLMVARYDHTYQQGIERFWSRNTRYDYYWPVFANIGEMAVKNREIYATGTPADDEVFGYQEAWADYRYKPNRVSGEMRSSAPLSLDVWHLGDYYTSQPYLSDAWIREDKSNVDRVLAVQSSVSNQFFADIYVQNRTTRPMPLYSVPGLIDHH